jgi:hypothetical protein
MHAGYRNLNRAKAGKAEQLSIGQPSGSNGRGLSGPKLQGYTSSAVFHNATFIANPKTISKVLQRQVKSVCGWIVGEWEPTNTLRQDTLNGKAYAVYAPNPRAIATGREITIDPKNADPTRRVFHYRDNGERVDTTQRYRVVWTSNHKCYIA